jgi:hypothetical protein
MVARPSPYSEEGDNWMEMEPTPEFEQVTEELPEYALLIDIPTE